MKSRIFSISLILIFLAGLSGCGCAPQVINYNLRLEIWGTDDDQYVFSDIVDNYLKTTSVVKEIQYRKFAADTYKQELLDALASGKGPDIFIINSSWTPSFLNKIVPAPTEIISEKKFRNDFVELASDEFIKDGKVYAVPLSVDSLALYYNKDLFNEAGIASPPKTWDEFVADANKLTKVDSYGNIVQSGAALGTAYNINRSTDLLGLLMLQNQTKMTENDGHIAVFDSFTTSGTQTAFPGENALSFYTDFAKIGSAHYTWNPTKHYSIDAFSEGNLAMMFNYSWHIGTIKNKSPKLNFDVAPVPQFPNSPKVDFGNSLGFVVAGNKIPTQAGGTINEKIPKSIREIAAWNFLKYLTTQPVSATQTPASKTSFDPAKNYLEKTNKPAARKDIINIQNEVYQLGVFAAQNLIAKTWTQLDPDAIEAILAGMIDAVNRGKSNASEAIRSAVARINQVVKVN